jgi:hypothetical protein
LFDIRVFPKAFQNSAPAIAPHCDGAPGTRQEELSSMAKSYLKLQQSEAVVVQAAAQIYAAYIVAGRVDEGQESEFMQKSIRAALRIAKATDEAVVSDEEPG